MSSLETLRAALAPAGMNLVGVVAADTWDAHAPAAQQTETLLAGAKSIVVFGNGGGALWKSFVADITEHTEHLCEELHPLDAFVRRSVQRADAALGEIRRRWFYSAATETIHLDFRKLGWLAGLGSRSRLGLLIHPTYGPWIGLRAACFLDAPWPSDDGLVPDLCDGCPAPCVKSCPGRAFPDGRWDVDSCSGFKRASDTCRSSCAAREACPLGREHRYPDLAVAYHNHRATGRSALAASIGIAPGADRFQGVGPHWDDWRKRVGIRAKESGT